MSHNYESVWNITNDIPLSKKNTVLTLTEREVLAISVDENGFEVDNQGVNFCSMSSSTIDSSYSFVLDGNHMLCIGRLLYEYNTKKKMWSKRSHDMPLDVQNRIGAACLSFGSKVMIFGGVVDGAVTNAIDVLNADFTTSRTLSILPVPLKFHTVTKISENEFILCGGKNAASNAVSDVYYGRVVSNRSFSPLNWEVNWAKLKPLNSARSKHSAVYVNNRLIVIGGMTSFDELNQRNQRDQNIINLNPWGPTTGSPLKRKAPGRNVEILKLKKSSKGVRAVAFTRNCREEMYLPFIISRKGWKDAKELPFSMIQGSVTVSPDEKYAVIVPGTDKESAKNVYLMDSKTLELQVVRREYNIDKFPPNTMDLTDGWNICDWRLGDTDDPENNDDDCDEYNLPCLNCSLIQQGSAISYADNRCPQCGNDTRSLIFGEL